MLCANHKGANMAYGLLNAGANVKSQAMDGMRSTANEENQRNIANKNIDAQEGAAKKANASAGATTGAMIGTQIAATGAATALSTGVAATGIAGMGVLGAGVATGGIGLLAGLVLSELF
jgi:hypothetical protein